MKKSFILIALSLFVSFAFSENDDFILEQLEDIKHKFERGFREKDVELLKLILSEELSEKIEDDLENELFYDKLLVLNFIYESLRLENNKVIVYGEVAFIDGDNSTVFFKEKYIFTFTISEKKLLLLSSRGVKSQYLIEVGQLGDRISSSVKENESRELSNIFSRHKVSGDEAEALISLLDQKKYFKFKILGFSRGIEGVKMNYLLNGKNETIVFPWKELDFSNKKKKGGEASH